MLSRNFYFTPTPRIAMYSETSAPIGAWEVNLEIMTDKPTDLTDRQTGSKGSFISKKINRSGSAV